MALRRSVSPSLALHEPIRPFPSFTTVPRMEFWDGQGVPVSDDAEVFFVFDRRNDSKPFTPREAKLAGYAIRGLTWFHRLLLNSHGIGVASSPLTDKEQTVMQLLLTDKSEKEIAAKLKQSPHSTHDHVKEIYRKLGVNGRTALMAIWLGNR